MCQKVKKGGRQSICFFACTLRLLISFRSKTKNAGVKLCICPTFSILKNLLVRSIHLIWIIENKSLRGTFRVFPIDSNAYICVLINWPICLLPDSKRLLWGYKTTEKYDMWTISENILDCKVGAEAFEKNTMFPWRGIHTVMCMIE